jgi:hypothetical protein
MPSADVCSVTPSVAARRAARVTAGFGGDSGAFAPALSPAPVVTTSPVGFDGFSNPFGLGLSATPVGTRTARETDLPGICDMNFQCITVALTLSPAPDGVRHHVLTHPGTEPSMRFLSVGSHLCARASSRQTLTELPLPSASGYIGPRGHDRYSYRGLSPHQFMPMPGVHPPSTGRPASRASLACRFPHAFGARSPVTSNVRPHGTTIGSFHGCA